MNRLTAQCTFRQKILFCSESSKIAFDFCCMSCCAMCLLSWWEAILFVGLYMIHRINFVVKCWSYNCFIISILLGLPTEIRYIKVHSLKYQNMQIYHQWSFYDIYYPCSYLFYKFVTTICYTVFNLYIDHLLLVGCREWVNLPHFDGIRFVQSSFVCIFVYINLTDICLFTFVVFIQS